MTTPANLTYSDLQTRVANHLRIPTSNTAEMTKIQAIINEVYRDIYVKQDWWWLLKRGVIVTVEGYDTGTANVAAGSTSVTLGTAPAAGLGSFVGYKFWVVGDTTDGTAIHRIVTHAAGDTAITLDAGFSGANNTAASFRIRADEYSVASDVGKLIKAQGWGRISPLTRITPEQMIDLKVWDFRESFPTHYCLMDFATTGDPTAARRLVVHPYPEASHRLVYWYKQELNTELSGATRPMMPDEYSQLLVYGALARAYPVMIADSERGQYFLGLFNDMLNLMTANHREYNQDRPSFQPVSDYRTRVSGRRRGRVTLGRFFDQWPAEP